jgi:TolA-binding protein
MLERARCYASALLALLVCTNPAVCWANSVCVQVVATSDKAKAEKVSTQINEAGAGPAHVQNSAEIYKVLSKPYDSLAEANFAKAKLRGAGFLDAFCVTQSESSMPNAGAHDFPSIVSQAAFLQAQADFGARKRIRTAPKITDQQLLINDATAGEVELSGKAFGFWKKQQAQQAISAFRMLIERFPQSPKIPAARLMLAYWLLEAANVAAAETEFEKVVVEFPDRPESGEARLRLAYINLRNHKDGEALKLFRELATTVSGITPDVQAEAALRTAALYHRGKDLVTSDQWYAAIEQKISDPETQAFAAMQRCGISLELAWNGKRTFDSVRTQCKAVLISYPGAAKETRATAAVMMLETLCYQQRFQEAVSLEPIVLPDTAGSASGALASYWLAKAHFEIGEASKASQILQGIIAENKDSQARFDRIQVVPQAKLLAAKINEQLSQN